VVNRTKEVELFFSSSSFLRFSVFFPFARLSFEGKKRAQIGAKDICLLDCSFVLMSSKELKSVELCIE